MARSVLQNACYIVILTLCVDRGDGHWKETDRENFRRDIELYRRMAEKIEREIEVFYDEYPDEQLERDNVDVIRYNHGENTFHRRVETSSVKADNLGKHNATPLSNVSSDVKPNQISYSENHGAENITDTANNTIKWPKFEEMLLEIGKKYDWKNDRWIKVKEKIKITEGKDIKEQTAHNEINVVHEKHKFYYKFVKLNRSKNRRSVVVAVSAIR